jgi:hypothetical protein
LVSRLRASGRRTLDKDCGSWPTPIVGDTTGGPRPPDDKRGPAPGLQAAAHLINWATPTTRDHKDGACLAQITGGGGSSEQSSRTASATNGFWQAADWLPCRDGKARPVEPGTFPLAHGVSARVGRLRAYGNAIVPQVAQVFIEAYLET